MHVSLKLLVLQSKFKYRYFQSCIFFHVMLLNMMIIVKENSKRNRENLIKKLKHCLFHKIKVQYLPITVVVIYKKKLKTLNEKSYYIIKCIKYI